MAIGDAYSTAEQYRLALDPSRTDDGNDSDILTDLKAVSRYLENKIGRFFNKDAADVARIYVAPATKTSIWIDDLSAAPTSIKVDHNLDGVYETELEATDYELWPLNAAKGPEARPYTKVCLAPWGTLSSFYEGDRIEITGKFGWPAVPEAIQRATIQLTAIPRLETPRATQRIPELSEVIGASPEAQRIVYALIDGYKRVRYI